MATAASRDVSASRASFNDEQKRIANARVHAARTDNDEQRVVSCGGVFLNSGSVARKHDCSAVCGRISTRTRVASRLMQSDD